VIPGLSVVNTLARLAVLVLALPLGSCQEEVEWVGPPPGALGEKPQAKSADRLPPGELLEGTEEVYGFAVPRGMTTVRKAPTIVHISGQVSFDALTDYVKDRIAARHAEMLEQKLVFPNARILGNKDQIFEITLMRQRTKCVLEIRDETRPPATQGLSEEERWKRAGLKPGGGLIDPNAME